MPLLRVPGWRSGDSLPSELRSGVKEWQGTNLMPSLRLSAGQSGLSGMSIHYGATEGPSGFRAYNWPPYGYRGMSGLGQGDTCIDNGDGTSTCFPSGDTSGTGGFLPCQSDDTGGLVMGQVYCSTGSTIPASSFTVPVGSLPQTTNVNVGGVTVQAQHPVGWTGAVTCAPGQACPQAPAGYQWVPMISATGNMLAQIMAIGQGGSYSTSPRGTAVSGTANAPAAGTAASVAQQQQVSNLFSGSGGMMLLLLGGGLLVVMMMSQSRR